MNLTTSLLLIFLCILFSAFFSAGEMSYSSANRLRMERLSEEGDRRAKRVLWILDRFEDALSTILIGNNLVNIASSSIASAAVLYLTGSDRMLWAVTAVITVLVILFGETVPKITAKQNANRFAMMFSGIIKAMMLLLRPVIRLVTFLTGRVTGLLKPEPESSETAELELQSVIDTAEDEGVIDAESSELIRNAMEFRVLTAEECMTSRVDMQAIDLEDSLPEIVRFLKTTPYTRIPVYQGTKDRILGILSLKDLFGKVADHGGEVTKKDIRASLFPPLYVYKTMSLPVVLRQMREKHQHLAVVTDEYAGTCGIITMEDVLEQVVGEIWDETDIVEQELIALSPGKTLVDGDAPLESLLELSEEDPDPDDFGSETAGGFVIEMLERFPKKNDMLNFRDLEIRVLSTDGLRIGKLLVTKKKETEPS